MLRSVESCQVDKQLESSEVTLNETQEFCFLNKVYFKELTSSIIIIISFNGALYFI